MPDAYATVADFYVFARGSDTLNGTAFADEANLERMLEAQSRLLDRDLGRHATVPLTSPSLDVVRDCCILAEYDVMAAIGYRDDKEAEQLRARYLDVVKRRPALAGEGHEASADATPGVDEGGPDVWSDPPRGW